MLYTYISTTVLESGPQGNWKTYIDPKQEIYEFLNFKYISSFIKIKDDNNNSFFIDTKQLYLIPNGINVNIETIFNQEFIENFFIPVPSPPEDNSINYLNYINLEREEFKIVFDQNDVDIKQSEPNIDRDYIEFISTNGNITNLPDLTVYKSRYETDIKKIDTSCLVAVNGFLHQTLYKEINNRTFILGGGDTNYISGYRDVSLLSFSSNNAEIQKVPLAGINRLPEYDDSLYGLVNFIDIPVDITNKIIMISLGGYLFTLNEDLFYKTGPNSFTINISKIGLERKIVEASRYININSLGLDSIIPNTRLFNYDLLRSNNVINAFLDLSQSFLIVLPFSKDTNYTNDFIRNEIRQFETIFNTKAFIRSRTGRIVSYWDDGISYDNDLINNERTLVLREFDDDTPIYRSSIYDKLIKAYPELEIRKYDLVNKFISIGFFN